MYPMDATRCCSPVLASPLSETDASELAGVLKALADPARLRLLSIIASSPNGEACACDLSVDRSQPTVSHHLSQLVRAGILVREQRGKWAWFRIDNDRLAEVCEGLTPVGSRDSSYAGAPSA
jgi:ArsR family transcriptional regulator, arsenate/arsenite/antimonite-responsive transcriptional repressor